PLPKIIGHAVADNAPAIAVCDTNNLFGVLEVSQKAAKQGVQPIVGCQLSVAFGDEPEQNRRGSHRRHGPDFAPLALFAATETGYRNLVRLVSRAYLDNPPGEAPHVLAEWLREHAEGIICLTGGPRGALAAALKADKAEAAENRLLFLKDVFKDRLYVELERLQGYDRTLESATIALAYRHELPLVATNEAFFPAREDYEAH